MVDLEGQEQAGVRSTASGERTTGDDVSFQTLVLSRGNLNEAYERVRRNKGVAGIDGMTVYQVLPYLKAHRDEFIAALRNGTYKPQPVRNPQAGWVNAETGYPNGAGQNCPTGCRPSLNTSV